MDAAIPRLQKPKDKIMNANQVALAKFLAANGRMIDLGRYGVADLARESDVRRAISEGPLAGIDSDAAAAIAEAAHDAPAKTIDAEMDMELSILSYALVDNAKAALTWECINEFDDECVDLNGHSMFDGLRGIEIDRESVAAMVELAIETHLTRAEDDEDCMTEDQIARFEFAQKHARENGEIWSQITELALARAEVAFAD